MGGSKLELVQHEAIERVVAAMLSKVLVLLPPWVLAVLLYIVAAISHALWGDPPAVTWTTMAATLTTVGLTALTWQVTHNRATVARIQTAGTAAAAGLWFTVANITGVTNGVTAASAFFGGGALAVAWNVRQVIRSTPGEGAHVGNPVRALLDGAKTKAGLDGVKVHAEQVTERKATAVIEVPDGKTVDDMQKKLPVLEAAAEVPPGSFHMTRDRTNSKRATVTITDPLVMDSPIPWPGPSRPGGSIAEPLDLGIYEDSEPMRLILPGNHVQIMGANGSGKSIGGAWNLLGEAITRRDVSIFGIDLAKGDQTLGPLRPALRRLETTKAGAVTLIRELLEEIPKRTDWLTQHGYTDWEEGCGLSYWVIVFEEVAKLFDLIGDKDAERVEQIVKEIRSAGGRVIMSLQRATFGEMPTIIRSQMAFMCFALANSSDGPYGLSERQQRADVSPEMWMPGDPQHQGKAYLDAVGVDEQHYAMPGRTYTWGGKSEATARMAAHAAQWPATAKEMDEFTARLAAPGGSAALPASGPASALPAAPGGTAGTAGVGDGVRDEVEDDVDERFAALLGLAAETVIAAQYASTEMLQRKLRLPHAESLRVMEALERKGVVGPRVGERGEHRVLVDAEDAADVVDQIRDQGDVVAQAMRTPDPDPSVTAGPDDEIRPPSAQENVLETDEAERQPMHPDAARELVEAWILHLHQTGRTEFQATDPELTAIRTRTGNSSRTWANNVLDRISNSGAITKAKKGRSTVYRITDPAALGVLVGQ
jgi:hypothetical protein